MEAVQIVHRLEEENRGPTPEEQAILVQFTGWGPGEIRNALFPHNSDPGLGYNTWAVRGEGWKDIAEAMKALFTEEDWKTVLRSTQYAHYTSEPIIRSIYAGLERMGFTGGSIVEPGAGSGLFAALMPEGIYRNSKYLGIELDGFSAKIAQAINPSQTIKANDFKKQKLPKDFFDLAIGNPPFANLVVKEDPAYRKQKFMLHDYFFAKTIDSVRPGGLLVFVTSNGTMDKKDTVAREYLRERADLLGAIRLPNTAFKKNANTEVTTDVIFLRKRSPGQAPAGENWTDIAEIKIGEGAATVN